MRGSTAVKRETDFEGDYAEFKRITRHTRERTNCGELARSVWKPHAKRDWSINRKNAKPGPVIVTKF